MNQEITSNPDYCYAIIKHNFSRRENTIHSIFFNENEARKMMKSLQTHHRRDCEFDSFGEYSEFDCLYSIDEVQCFNRAEDNRYFKK